MRPRKNGTCRQSWKIDRLRPIESGPGNSCSDRKRVIDDRRFILTREAFSTSSLAAPARIESQHGLRQATEAARMGMVTITRGCEGFRVLHAQKTGST